MQNSNEAKIFDFIRQWQQNGLSQKAWCAQHKFAYSSFHYWHRRFRRQQTDAGNSAGNEFVQLVVDGASTATPWGELIVANGSKFIFHQPLPATFIRSLPD